MKPPPYISEDYLATIIRAGLDEDVGERDVTSEATVSAHTHAQGKFVCKQDGVVAGLAVAARVFAQVDERIDLVWDADDGEAVVRGRELGRVSGPARGILAAERLALNIMQRMSGIATMTGQMAEAAKPFGTKILDTRKTAPGLRLLDKWAVLLGGGSNHRIGLFDMILVKENHVTCAGGLVQAVAAARRFAAMSPHPLRIEVEVTTLDEVRQALEIGGIDILLLDNMAVRKDDGTLDVSALSRAVDLVDGAVKTEASGNVTLDTVAQIAATGVDNISCGALTHSVTALDISLLLDFRD
jgi:nicotinate-nucleotide pyrophosphorylase (carboxylating)